MRNTMTQDAFESITAHYRWLVEDGQIKPDPAQLAAAAQLDQLANTLTNTLARHRRIRARQFWCRFVTGSFLTDRFLTGRLSTEPSRRPRGPRGSRGPRGLYIYGDVGRGKSMLMDMFFDHVAVARKRRVHFHAFMQETHQRIHDYRQNNKKSSKKTGDPILAVAAAIASEAQLLCFDEFQVKDIADASILGRLFALLLDAGICVVATSNRAPDDLYSGGLNRHRFLSFIDLLKQRLDILFLQAETDYRLARLQARPVWFTPCGAAARKALDERFATLTGGVHGAPMEIALKGRNLPIARAADGVARVSFDDLCGSARGAGDYLALAEHFHTILIDNIPRLRPDKGNEAVRFVTLIDALYENRVKLLVSAEAQAQDLYPSGDKVFEFQRTVSRLMEMQSSDYLALDYLGNHDGGRANSDGRDFRIS